MFSCVELISDEDQEVAQKFYDDLGQLAVDGGYRCFGHVGGIFVFVVWPSGLVLSDVLFLVQSRFTG